MADYSHLFAPIEIGTMTARNRLLMSAMSINFGVDQYGYPTDQLTQYLVARARGGAGMMLVGGGAIDPTGLELPDLPKLWEDGCIGPLKTMVDAVRPFGACFGMQLMHGGRQSYHDQKVAPSPIPAPAVVKGVPRELGIAEIHGMAAAFGDAARRCRDAGFDFIEIHAAHGYLINQFMSPNANQRRDEYGGSFDNRIRFMLEVFDDIKTKAGCDFPVGVRINGKDYIENGWGLQDALKLAVILEKQGADYLHVSAGVYGSTQLTIPSMYVPAGCFVDLAAAVKQVVAIPVVAVGRIKDPALADQIIADGKADVVAMGRALIADPDLPNKARGGRQAQIRPCIGCCLGCIHAVLQREPGGCVANPDVGREYLLTDTPKQTTLQQVLIVGAGPAGLAAARQAALQGHRVCVCDASDAVGGVVRLAARAPGRRELMDIIQFFASELKRLHVDVRLQTELDEALLDEIEPDQVWVAGGGLPELPIIKGLFACGMALFTVLDVFKPPLFAQSNVVIIGGNQAALTAADTLAEAGKTVTVLHRGRHFAEEMSSNDRFYLRERLKRDNIALHKGVSIQSVTAGQINCRIQGHAVAIADIDAVVVAEGMKPVRQSLGLLKRKKIAFALIGDAKIPRGIMHAISEGEEAARALGSQSK
jgi:2,4-dienoyl-CoA reductase-like NADH-dependent reductase (Old Yellow Enzyme family)